MTSHSGEGHVGPLLPFAAALRRAGAEVMIAAPPRGRALVEGSGLAFWPFYEGPGERRDAVFSSLWGGHFVTFIATDLAAGNTNRNIAVLLNISAHTVRRHLQNIFDKIGVSSRAAATAFVLAAAT